jgi:hypothetical protein
MSAFADADEGKFQEAIEALDQRVFATVGEFFDLLRQGGATLRLVTGDKDESFGNTAVERAVERATSTTVSEEEDLALGQLSGALPEGHMFEFRRENGDVIRGRVDRSITSDQLMQMNLTLLNVNSNATLRVRRVRKDGALARESFTLLGLERA